MRSSRVNSPVLAMALVAAVGIAGIGVVSVRAQDDTASPGPASPEATSPVPIADPGNAPRSPEPSTIPLVSESGRPDLYLDMPYYLGGFEPEIVMTRGQEHFAGLDTNDQDRQDLEGLLDAVGAEPADLVSGYALVSQEDFFSFVVAIRIEGAKPGLLLPAYLPTLLDDLEDPRVSTSTIGDKDVTLVTTVGDDGDYVDLTIYDEGDTIWIVQGPPDVVAAAVADLPEPLPAE